MLEVREARDVAEEFDGEIFAESGVQMEFSAALLSGAFRSNSFKLERRSSPSNFLTEFEVIMCGCTQRIVS